MEEFTTEMTSCPDSIMSLMFPRTNLESSPGTRLFNHAYALDVTYHSDNQDSLSEILDTYLESFNLGVLEAGANLLRIMLIAVTNSEDSPPSSILNRINYILARLTSKHHPIGEYYEALCLIFNINEYPDKDDELSELGFEMMFDLAELGNAYAIDFLTTLDL